MNVPCAKGRSIAHDFGNLPPVLSPEKLKQAVDSYDKNALIKGHMRLTLQVAAIYTNNDADLIGAAMLGLVYAVDRWPLVRKDDNITPYIVACAHSKIRDYLDSRAEVRIPGRTRRAKKMEIAQHYVHDYDPPAQEEAITPELREILEMCCVSYLEKTIVTLRGQNYKDPEIAKIVGYTKSYIANIRSQVKTRFLQLWSQ